MFFVCLSHFAQVYLSGAGAQGAARLPYLLGVGMIASPTFVVVSGSMLGLLSVVQGERFAALRTKLVDRALFLLTVAHVLIAASRLSYQVHPVDALRMTFMTDTLAVSVLAGVWLIGRTSRRVRVLLGVASFVSAWALLYWWAPTSTGVSLAKDVLTGGMPDRVLMYSVPLLPWFGVYIAATAFGELLGDCYVARHAHLVERYMGALGVSAVTAAIVLDKAGGAWARTLAPSQARTFWMAVVSPWSKLPPSPTYLLFFGGTGMLLIAAVTAIAYRGHAHAFVREAAIVGRSSLAVFVIQFYVFFTLLGALHLPYTPWWPVFFAVGLALNVAFAHWWDGHDLNRYLTMRLPVWTGRRRAARDTAAHSAA